MFVKMTGLYGLENDDASYYRKIGIGCFDFVTDKKVASDISEDEAKRILANSAFYLKMYNADKLTIE